MAEPKKNVEAKCTLQIQPAKGLGWMSIGASLFTIINRLKLQSEVFTAIELIHCSDRPTLEPIIVNLPSNGLRLRFDGPNQQLRLIEILDFSRTTFTYKNTEIARRTASNTAESAGPSFRQIYNRLFGPAYAGDYIPPSDKSTRGTYILSYPGVAIRFNLDHASWSEKADFVSLLSTAASPATSLAIFNGPSWPEAQQDLYEKALPYVRFTGLTSKNDVPAPDEIREVLLYGEGRVELVRQTTSNFRLQLGKATAQDVVVELGPPDAIFRKASSRLSIHARSKNIGVLRMTESSGVAKKEAPMSRSVMMDMNSDDDVSDEAESDEIFYNYFHYGIDILLAENKTSSHSSTNQQPQGSDSSHGLTVTKILLHGNVPGSYAFNRYRRSRWTLRPPGLDVELNSEMLFTEISQNLKRVCGDREVVDSGEDTNQRGMILNRSWGESSESSIELLGEMDDAEITNHGDLLDQIPKNNAVSSNTQLFEFPGMLFEVINGGCISCVTIY